MLTIYITESA